MENTIAEYNKLKLEKKDGIATLTLDRPERLNALTVEMGREVNDAIEAVKNDLDSRVLGAHRNTSFS